VIDAGPVYIPADRKYPEGGFKNFGNGPGGTYDMAGAFRHSVNTWFVELEDRVGVRRVANLAHDMGLTSLPLEGENAITEKDAALTLGVYEASPLQVASAYATFAAQGMACRPIGITNITGPQGKSVQPPSADCRQVLRPSTANTITAMLTSVVDGSDEGRTGKLASLGGRPVAGKTGSTNDYGAAWFAGYTPQYATAVWVGDPRGPQFNMQSAVSAYGGSVTFAPVFGGSIPAMIFQDVMSDIHEGLPVLDFPPAGGASALGSSLVTPDVRGLTAEQALGVLRRYGLEAVVRTSEESVVGLPPGRVVRTVPAPGLRQPGDPDTVVLFVVP
jgi:membrane peptidoglycan carboxypeptidase